MRAFARRRGRPAASAVGLDHLAPHLGKGRLCFDVAATPAFKTHTRSCSVCEPLFLPEAATSQLDNLGEPLMHAPNVLW
jgi:hypothetical protein